MMAMEVLLHELPSVPNGAKLFHILTTNVKKQGRREKKILARVAGVHKFSKIVGATSKF
jgi:hypothetical protein